VSAHDAKRRAVALNLRLSREENPEGLLRLLGAELPDFNDINVATVFSMLGKLCCGSRSFPRNIAADARFCRLTALAREMCADGRLEARQLANIVHAVAKMSAVGRRRLTQCNSH
jgi:hypothetical protein